ncbi:hypothetical protein AAE478_002513 [Parahypoxylon ruwenzoriense]
MALLGQSSLSQQRLSILTMLVDLYKLHFPSVATEFFTFSQKPVSKMMPTQQAASQATKEVEETVMIEEFEGDKLTEQIDSQEFEEQLRSCNLSLFGDSGGNDFVWHAIAHQLGWSVNKLKRETGLSPTKGAPGIDHNAVRGLLTSLGRAF